MAGGNHSKGNPFVQALIVLALVLGMVALFRLTGDGSLLEQPRGAPGTIALVAFGFVVLASFTIGRFVDAIRLPHITGYLLAGVLFGESVAHLAGEPFLGLSEQLFGEGLAGKLREYGRVVADGFLFSDGKGGGTLGSLSVIKTLAVALIAMTAGGELKLESLRQGFKSILGVLLGQSLVMFVLVTGAVALFGGALLTDLPTESSVLAVSLGMGLVVAAISLATSPAATIAVVNETQSDGPVTRTVLAAVVLKDVIVVIAFSLAVAVASSTLGIADEVSLGEFLLTHIVFSILGGVALGGIIALYLRFVGRELLLMILAVVYAATLFANDFHLDPVLVFLATGFTASNFSKDGDKLIHSVEQLSAPVYVVFFTLAGAELHLEELFALWPWAIGLVLLRALSVYLGVWLGAKATGAEATIQQYSWLGFLSQAGVAIVLSELVGNRLGATGEAFQRILIAGVALNELFGPMLLKLGLSAAGEVGEKGSVRSNLSSDAPAAPEQSGGREPSLLPPAGRGELPSWPAPAQGERSEPPEFRSEALTKEIGDLVAQLDAITLGVAKGPLRRAHLATEAYFRALRREFLRSHRRLSVRLRDVPEEESARQEPLARILHREQAELVRRWRTEVIGRASAVRTAEWSPDQLVETLDKIVESCPEWLLVPYEEQSFQRGNDQGPLRSLRRGWLRFRRVVAGAFGTELQRRIPFRALARYHFYGATPARLEALAELLSRAEMHLLGRSRELFEDVIVNYERSIGKPSSSDDKENLLTDAELKSIREQVEEKLEGCIAEADRMALNKSELLSSIFSHAIRDLAEDLRVAGTLDLAGRTRRSSKVFHDRFRALSVLSEDLQKVRDSIGGSYRMLAMELELLGLEAEIRDVLDDQGRSLSRTIRGRAHTQAARVTTALEEMLSGAQEAIKTPEQSGEGLASSLRDLLPPLRKTTDEAVEATTQLYEQLSDDNTLAPLLDLLRKATGNLSESYEVPSKAVVFKEPGRLPEPVSSLEVPFRNLVSGHFEGTIAPELANVTRIVAGELHPLVTGLQELSRLIDLKFDLAVAELDAVLDDTVQADTKKVVTELVVTGFQRNQELLKSQVEAANNFGKEVEVGLRQHTLDGLHVLRRKLVQGKLSQLRIDVMRRKAARRRFLRRAEELPSRLEQLRVLLRKSVVALVGDERLETWWRWLGLPEGEVAAPSIADFPEPVPQVELPLVYRRLFSAEALDLRSLRTEELARARAALAHHGNGRIRSAVFVGPEGVGKGAMLQAAVRSAGFKSVKRLAIDRPASVADVDAWFADANPGQLWVVSGFHWLLSMEPGGFDPLRRFVDRILSDRGQGAFLLSADEVVWNMAGQVVALDCVFTEVIPLTSLTQEELEAVVLGRHRLSGSGVNFERATPNSSLEELLVRGAGQIRRPYQTFFQALHESSGGFVREAFRLWLASIHSMGRDFVRMGNVPMAPNRALRRLPDDLLLQLVQVARQGWTQPSTFASLYRTSLAQAQARLARLSKLGLIVHEASGAYTISPHLRAPLFRVLRERGWV